MNKPEFFQLSERAVNISFGNIISPEVNDHVIGLSRALKERPFDGFWECVPAYSSLAVYFDPLKARRTFEAEESILKGISAHINSLEKTLKDNKPRAVKVVEIPAHFGGDAGLDIKRVSERTNLSESDVIDIFLSKKYRVYMLGFLPGFAYMGDVDKRIAVPRKRSPRLKVPAGSIGIAGTQTGIYPADSPGGWQIIGQTDFKTFSAETKELFTLNAGDEIRFKAL